MKNMEEMRQCFERQALSKPDYIDGMYNHFHSQLFSYASWLQKTNVARIEVTDGKVVMTSRDNGVKIVCPKFDKRVAPIEILNFGDYELVDSNMIMKLVKPDACALDIGANMGWYDPNVSIYAFEPIESTYLALQENVRVNELNNIKTFNFGFSSEEKTLEFYFYPGGSGNASSANLSNRPDVKKVSCNVKVLDKTSTMLNFPKVDFIKCDVEGAELFVFQGALKLLAKDKPIVFTEMLRKWADKFDYHPNEIIELFHGLGYQCFTADTEGKLRASGLMDELTQETNFFFLHEVQHALEINQLLAK